MSQNLSLIKYFVSEFYMDKPMELAHVVSPGFYFTVNSGYKQSFEIYASHLKLIKQNAELTISELRAVSENIVEVDFTIFLIADGEYEKIFGTAEYIIANGLLEHANIIYHHADDEISHIHSALFGVTEQKSESFFV